MGVPLPQFTDGVGVRYFIEPLNAPSDPLNALDRFPSAVYNKSVDSHFTRFMYTLLGPVGVGWLKLGLTEARLVLEAAGANLSGLDAAYGDPFSLARSISESDDVDTSGLLPASVWDQLRAQDEAYRSRALEFLKAAGQGTTPLGMALAASSGVGQPVDIIENHQYLFDSHADDLLGFEYCGVTLSTGEFIIVPRPSISLSEQQTIDFATGTVALGANNFTLAANGFGSPATGVGALSAGATAADVQTALVALPTIGQGNVTVTGGPAPAAFIVTFINNLSNQSVATLVATIVDPYVGTPLGVIPVETVTGALDPNSEQSVISDAARHSMEVAIDYLRPVAAFPSFNDARSLLHSQPWATTTASSAFTQVIRFVTGTTAVAWPAVDSTHWIVASEENEAPSLQTNIQQHYTGFHNIASVQSYSDTALLDPAYATDSRILTGYGSDHIGSFPEMLGVMPYFSQFTDPNLVFSAPRCLTDYPEPLTVSAQSADGTAYINNVYPADYASLQGVPALAYHDDHFWSSRERADGAEILEIDLGSPQAVNYLSLEVSRKPVTIAFEYDLLDQSPARKFVPVSPIAGFPTNDNLFFDPAQRNPWEHLELYFNDGLDMIFTRFIRLTFTRRNDSTTYGRFLFNTVTQVQTPWSIDVRHLRLGRNIAPAVS